MNPIYYVFGSVAAVMITPFVVASLLRRWRRRAPLMPRAQRRREHSTVLLLTKPLSLSDPVLALPPLSGPALHVDNVIRNVRFNQLNY